MLNYNGTGDGTMMEDWFAIVKAYPSIVTVDDTFTDYGLDKDGNKVFVEKEKIDAARVELDAEYAKVKYKDDRKAEYPAIGEQLDNLYHAIDGDADLKAKFADFHSAIKAVKDKYPKSS